MIDLTKPFKLYRDNDSDMGELVGEFTWEELQKTGYKLLFYGGIENIEIWEGGIMFYLGNSGYWVVQDLVDI